MAKEKAGIKKAVTYTLILDMSTGLVTTKFDSGTKKEALISPEMSLNLVSALTTQLAVACCLANIPIDKKTLKIIKEEYDRVYQIHLAMQEKKGKLGKGKK